MAWMIVDAVDPRHGAQKKDIRSQQKETHFVTHLCKTLQVQRIVSVLFSSGLAVRQASMLGNRSTGGVDLTRM